MLGSQPESPRTRTERYLRLVRPVARGCWGIAAAVAVFSAAGAIGGRGGLLNFRQCRETHCAITGPGWVIAALLGFAAGLTPGSELSWYRVTGASLAVIAVCILGYGLEWTVAARTGSHALR